MQKNVFFLEKIMFLFLVWNWVHVSFLSKMFFTARMKKCCFFPHDEKNSNLLISHVKKRLFLSPGQKKHHIQIRRGSLDQQPSHQAEQTLKTVFHILQNFFVSQRQTDNSVRLERTCCWLFRSKTKNSHFSSSPDYTLNLVPELQQWTETDCAAAVSQLWSETQTLSW